MQRRVLHGIFGIAIALLILSSIPITHAQMAIDITEPGTYVVYTQSASPYRITIINTANPNSVWNLGIGTWNSFPSVCGTKLTYHLSGDIRVRDLTNDTDTVIAQGEYPRWIPGCERVSYKRRIIEDTVHVMKLWTNSIAGGDEIALTNGAHAHWHTTQNKFAYHYAWKIWLYVDGNMNQVGADIPSDYPTLSPNGLQIVYNFSNEIWIYDGASNRQIGTGYYPNWIDNDSIIWQESGKLRVGDIGASGIQNVVEIGNGDTPFVWTVPEPPPPPPEHTMIPQVDFNPARVFDAMTDFASRLTNAFETSLVQGTAGLVFMLFVLYLIGRITRPIGAID